MITPPLPSPVLAELVEAPPLFCATAEETNGPSTSAGRTVWAETSVRND